MNNALLVHDLNPSSAVTAASCSSLSSSWKFMRGTLEELPEQEKVFDLAQRRRDAEEIKAPARQIP